MNVPNLQIIYRIFDAVVVSQAIDALAGRTPEVAQLNSPLLLFNVRGSKGRIYTVELSCQDGEAVASCHNTETQEDCKALQFNGYCYHLGAVFKQLSARQTLLLLDDTLAAEILSTLAAFRDRLTEVEARLKRLAIREVINEQMEAEIPRTRPR